MSFDSIVIGVGLAGLTAALRLSEEGQRVLVVAKGVGATHLAPAAIDVLGYVGDERVDRPAASIPSLVAEQPDHPYARVSPELVAASLDWLARRAPELGYAGSVDENMLLPTAAGVPKPSALVPETMAAGDLRGGGRFVFVGLRGLKDFYASYLAENLSRAGVSARAVELEPPLGRDVDLGGVAWARRFDEPELRDWVVGALAGKIEPDERVGFPAVLGLRNAREVWRELERGLERRVFEVPTLPPSVPGIRLFETLKAALRGSGGRLVVGDTVVGAETEGERVVGVVTETAARPVTHRARSFVLASGGFASAGLELDSHGLVRETVFGLPVAGVPEADRPRFAPGYFDPQPLARAGLAVDDLLRPVDAEGSAVYENLYTAGAILGGAVPWREKSGTGISLATGYAAAAAILEHSPTSVVETSP